MDSHAFTFRGETLRALPSGALHWPGRALLVVSDLHLGKSARLAAVGGAQLPPYESRETLQRLTDDLERTGARQVICLGDSFDAPDVEAALPSEERRWITRLQAGRDWVWIEGNHDPGPVALGGAHRAELRLGPLVFRHIAQPFSGPVAEPGDVSGDVSGQVSSAVSGEVSGEVSGHYHPKAQIRSRAGGRVLSRPCFLLDKTRLILPAYGAFTGGLWTHAPALCDLMAPEALAILTGARALAIPMPRGRLRR